MRRVRARLNGGMPFLAAQAALYQSPAIIKAMFGGWGSGKTRGAANAFLSNCLANPYVPAVHGPDRPFSLVVGFTHKVLKDSSHREFIAICPPEMIKREVRSPDWEIELANKHLVKFRTVRGALEGASACGVWLDEAHLLRDETVFLNYQMRARDPRGRRFVVIVSGLPVSGWLQDTFDRPEHARDPQRCVVMARTEDNHHLPPHVVEQFKRSASLKNKIVYLEGRWMPPEDAIFYEFSTSRHVIKDPGDRGKATHISFDIGDRGSILFVQERLRNIGRIENGRPAQDLTLHVVDEIVTENASAEQQMLAARARGWPIVPGLSKIFADPTIRRDEISAVRRVFGDEIGLVYQKRGTAPENVEFGIGSINAALCDAEGRVRLTFSDRLPVTERSLLSALPRYHRNPAGKPKRDNVVDHVCDALRYPVAHLLPRQRTLIRAVS